ncbi:glycosyltransferase family 4 protein [Sphingomonas sp.]|uniref:glycosyltransferase family 4 protein n=1 Tax=Sphingomonas sp. TaxID=28214 RepID=UPI00286C2F9C|nr:glycosyltransferase family 4 protein [Sphingomonas sp.]
MSRLRINPTGTPAAAAVGPVVLSSNSLWNITNFRAPVVRRLAYEGWSLVVAAPATEQERTAFTLPADVMPIVLKRSGLNPLRDIGLLLRYCRVLHEIRPAAYLGWTIKPNIYGALAARMAGVPAILNVSGLGTAFLGSGLLARFVGLLYRVAFARAHVIFFQNGDDRALFVERRLVRAEQARLLPGSGIDLDHYRQVPLPEGPPTFLLIARLLGDKGVREYVTAARMLREELPGVRFRLLGPIDSDNRSAVTQGEVDGWVTEGVVDYLGTADDVRSAIAAASVVVLPSYREGLPRTLLEAAAMGRPLIATDVPGCRDLVDEGVNGTLCAARNAGSLAEAMRRMAVFDPKTLGAMGRASRDKAECGYDERLIADAYVGALRELAVTA